MEYRTERNRNGWSRIKLFLGLVVLVFTVTLAVVVGHRLSDDALAVLAGAVCGVGAAIPTSLLIVAVNRRRDHERGEDAVPGPSQGAYAQHQLMGSQSYGQSPYPPVVVVTPQGAPRHAAGWNALPPSLTSPTQRTFTVVGGTPSEIGEESYECYP